MYSPSTILLSSYIHDTSVRKLFSQLIGFSDGLVQAEAASRTRAERSAHVDLAIILHGVEAPCCHLRPRPVMWYLSRRKLPSADFQHPHSLEGSMIP